MSGIPTLSEVANKMKSDVSAVMYNTLNTGLDALTLPAKLADDIILPMTQPKPVPFVVPTPSPVALPALVPGLPVPQITAKPFPTPFGYVSLPVVEFVAPKLPSPPKPPIKPLAETGSVETTIIRETPQANVQAQVSANVAPAQAVPEQAAPEQGRQVEKKEYVFTIGR